MLQPIHLYLDLIRYHDLMALDTTRILLDPSRIALDITGQAAALASRQPPGHAFHHTDTVAFHFAARRENGTTPKRP